MADLDPKQMHRMLLERVREDTALIKEGKGKMATVTAENEALAQVGRSHGHEEGRSCSLPHGMRSRAPTRRRRN